MAVIRSSSQRRPSERIFGCRTMRPSTLRAELCRFSFLWPHRISARPFVQQSIQVPPSSVELASRAPPRSAGTYTFSESVGTAPTRSTATPNVYVSNYCARLERVCHANYHVRSQLQIPVGGNALSGWPSRPCNSPTANNAPIPGTTVDDDSWRHFQYSRPVLKRRSAESLTAVYRRERPRDVLEFGRSMRGGFNFFFSPCWPAPAAASQVHVRSHCKDFVAFGKSFRLLGKTTLMTC